jgi:predicted RNase H-like HicB family nuclease
MSDEQARVERCPTCGSYGHVVTSDEGTSYFAPQQARVDLADALDAAADDTLRRFVGWDYDDWTAFHQDLREAASTLTTYEQALEAADELARVVEESPVGYGLPRSARAYRSARPTSTKEEQNNGD